MHIKDQFLPYFSLIAFYFCIKIYFYLIRNEIKNFSKCNSEHYYVAGKYYDTK